MKMENQGLPAIKSQIDRESFFWVYFVPLWAVPLCFFVLKNYHPMAIMLYYQVIFRVPHFVMTYLILNEKSVFSRKNLLTFLKYFIPPLFIILLVYLVSFFDSQILKYFILLTFLISFHHNNTQAMGITLMFLSPKSSLQIKAIKFSFWLLLFISIEPMIVFVFRVPSFFPVLFLDTLKVIFAGSVLYLTYQIAIKGRNFKFLWYFLVSVFALFPWGFYQHYVQQFLVHNLHHSMNYLGIGIALIAGPQVSTFRNFKGLKVYMSCLAIALLFGFFNHRELANLDKGFGFMNCFFFIHYYVESRMWKDRELNLKDIPLFNDWNRKNLS